MIDTTNMGIMSNLIQQTSSTIASNMLSKKDSDSDSTLDISELGVSSELFSEYDLDSDSSLSKSELATAIETAMSQFNEGMPSKEEFQSILSDFGFETSDNSTNSNLSSSQLDTISSVLENYDANNLSKSDAQEIIAAFKQAGIEPSSDLESAMEEAGFDASEVGSLAEVAEKTGSRAAQSGGGGSGGGGSSSSESEDYDLMDLNEDGVVSMEEIQEYYGTSTENSTETLSSTEKNISDNLELLMETLKSSKEDDSIDSNSFNGLLKVINNQNNNSELNAYLETSNTSSMFDYA